MNGTNEHGTSLPLNEVVRVPVECLALDRSNPRLTGADGDATDESIIARLYMSADLGELLQSIATNGYMDIEPLIVLACDGGLTVLEGNRRLATIRLFREPELVSRIRERERVRIAVPGISAEIRGTLDQVSIYRVESRAEARSFIGFKHVNGAARWESYAKAKFAADWYMDGGSSLSEIASRIGDNHDTVKRMVNAIYVLEQADSCGAFRLDDRASPRFNFSHLYTALARASYMRFLGLEAAWSRYDPQSNRVQIFQCVIRLSLPFSISLQACGLGIGTPAAAVLGRVVAMRHRSGLISRVHGKSGSAARCGIPPSASRLPSCDF